MSASVCAGTCAGHEAEVAEAGAVGAPVNMRSYSSPPACPQSVKSSDAANSAGGPPCGGPVAPTRSLRERRGPCAMRLGLDVPGRVQDVYGSLSARGYVVGDAIGRSHVNGGFKVVVAQRGERRFAVKLAHESAEQGILIETLRNEYGVLRRLAHAGVVCAEELVEAANGCAVVMELCGGSRLDLLMHRGSALDGRGRHAALGAILDSVSYLHGMQVAHLDLHGKNVMVDAAPASAGGAAAVGSVKLVDFGSARALAPGAADQRVDSLDDLMRAILPPECVSGEDGASPPACDVFAVGLLAAGLAAGRPWFTAEVVGMSTPEVSIPDGAVELSSAGRAHLHSMLSLSPDRRPNAKACFESLPPFECWLA